MSQTEQASPSTSAGLDDYVMLVGNQDASLSFCTLRGGIWSGSKPVLGADQQQQLIALGRASLCAFRGTLYASFFGMTRSPSQVSVYLTQFSNGAWLPATPWPTTP